MLKFEKEMLDILKALKEGGVLQNCIISGSWAMYFYDRIFKGFEPMIATTDFDIFFPSVCKIKKSNITLLLSELHYLREDDYFSGKTKYYSKEGFELEFLTLPDRTMSNVIKIKSLNIGAEALPKMKPLEWNYITVDYNGIGVNIPSPSSYCLQKLLINKERPLSKQMKDINAVKYVMSFVNSSQKYRDEFIESFQSLPKKWQKTIKETIEIHLIQTPLENLK